MYYLICLHLTNGKTVEFVTGSRDFALLLHMVERQGLFKTNTVNVGVLTKKDKYGWVLSSRLVVDYKNICLMTYQIPPEH